MFWAISIMIEPRWDRDWYIKITEIYDVRCHSSIVHGAMKQINLARCIYCYNNSQQILGVSHKCVTSRALSYLLASSRDSFASSCGQSGPTEYPESWLIATHCWRSQHIATDHAICLDPDHHYSETWWDTSCCDLLRWLTIWCVGHSSSGNHVNRGKIFNCQNFFHK